jgi:hypothetical protein
VIPFARHAADADLIARVLAETRVARSPARPSIVAWLGALLEAALRGLGAWAERAGLGADIVEAAKIIALVVLLLAAVPLALAAARAIRALSERRRPAAPAPAWEEVARDGRPEDPREWRRRIEERLARGDVAGALEALWWWLALSVAPDPGVDASWTTRELLQRARRPELLPMGSGLDVLMYGRTSPSREDIRACLARFEERLA